MSLKDNCLAIHVAQFLGFFSKNLIPLIQKKPKTKFAKKAYLFM